jgi:hypothetical protein
MNQTFDQLRQAALPLDDEEWGSPRQMEAQNAFFVVAKRAIQAQPMGEAKWANFENDFCLKATTEEMVDEAIRLMQSGDPRDPDYTREGVFIYHNCWKCNSGKLPCVHGSPSRCGLPHARND